MHYLHVYSCVDNLMLCAVVGILLSVRAAAALCITLNTMR